MVCVKKEAAAGGCEAQTFYDGVGAEAAGGINRGRKGAGGEGEGGVEGGKAAEPTGWTMGTVEDLRGRRCKGLVPSEFNGGRCKAWRVFLEVRET